MRLSVKVGMVNQGKEWGEWWECGESGGNDENVGNQVWHDFNQGGNAGN